MNKHSIRIAFVGLPGAGKSTVGGQLAQRLGVQFVDSDHVIEQRIGCSIREFFGREGELAFRDLEQEVIDELTQGSAYILSTGGGVVLREVNRLHLYQRTHSIYLHAAPEDVFRRLRHDQSRPLLQGVDLLAQLKELYGVRDPLYREISRFVIDAGRSKLATLVNAILIQLELASIV